MASANPCSLSLGASHLCLAVFSHSPGGLVLEQTVHRPLSGDPSLKDRWLEAVPPALAELSSNSLLSSVTSVVLPGWAVLGKVLKVARIEGEGQREVVRFEAENVMPNGLEGHEWSYSILNDDGFEREVLVQAVSSEFLNELLKALSSHGVHPSRVDAVLSCQLEALQNQYGEASGSSVLLDVGSRSVSLIVKGKDESSFLRTFNFGGALVTLALAKQLGSSFQEAESKKLDWVKNTGDPENQDVLNQCSEGFVSRLVNEVQRSLALFRRQEQKGNPKRILLTGGGSQLPGLADFLERKTGIPCAFYDPFLGVSSGPGLATSQAALTSYALAASMGMAFGSLNNRSEPGNLLPNHATAKLALSEKRPWQIASVALLILSALLVGLKFHMGAWDLQAKANRLEAELAPLKSLSQKVGRAHQDYLQLSSSAQAKAKMIEQRPYWVAFLSDLQGRLNKVQDVWLEAIASEETPEGASGDRLRLTGSLLDRENPLSLVSSNSRGRVEVLLGSIEDSPFIQSVENRRFDTSRPGILQFDFSLVMNPEGAL